MAGAETETSTRLVLGTAGHIDHGKTSLIRALTGVETDRLPEEQARGITIELGFAALDLGDGLRVGVVDVPGHEGLVRTMVSGATGIDLVLLVVAADEGIMPQTREHLAICGLLGVTHAAVALTKIDAVDAELAELAEAEVREELGSTGLADAEVYPVSSRTGEGVEALRDGLAALARRASARTPRDDCPRLAVDRSFAMRGFGSVATGTLVGGTLSVGDAVEVLPGGARGRIRGLQSHGEDADRIAPGARCAANLQGVELAELPRGSVVTLPDRIAPTRTLDGELHWLEVAPEADRAAVELLVGTAERRAHLAPIGAALLTPGTTGFARIHVEGEPLPSVPGERFIVRGFARTAMGGSTLGGGRIIDVAPPHQRRSDPALLRDLEQLATGKADAVLAVHVERAGLSGIDEATLRRRNPMAEERLTQGFDALREAERAVRLPSGRWLARAALDDIETRLLDALDRFHEREPLQPGMPTATLRGALPENVARESAEHAIARLAERGAIAVSAERAARPDFAPTLSPEQEQTIERIRETLREAALEPPALRELAERLGTPAEPLPDLLAHLERAGELVRARDDLWFVREEVDALRERVVAHLREHGELGTPDYKSLIGTSRRTAVPLMELFDDEHVTFRKGDVRVLRDG